MEELSGAMGGGGMSASNSSSSANGDFMGGGTGGGSIFNFGPAPGFSLGAGKNSTNTLLIVAGAVLIAIIVMKKRG